MTHRERVLAALRHEQPDKVPCSIGYTVEAYARMREFLGGHDPHSLIESSLGGVSADPANFWREVEPDIWEDAFGVQWNRRVDKSIGVVCNQRTTLETIDDYEFPDIDNPPFDANYDEDLAKQPDTFNLANLGFSLFERAWTLVGMEALLVSMVAEPELVHKLLDRILEYNLRVIERACSHNIDGIIFGDDWGMQTGLIMGAARWREFIKPRIRQMYGVARAHGKYVFIHSCGKVDEVFPDLIECGLNVFNPFQPEVIDVAEAKRLYGDSLTFFGGISTQRTLPYGTPQQVRDEVRRLIEVVGKNGGYIAAPAHGIPGDAKPENILAMIEVLREQ